MPKASREVVTVCKVARPEVQLGAWQAGIRGVDGENLSPKVALVTFRASLSARVPLAWAFSVAASAVAQSSTKIHQCEPQPLWH